MPEELFSAVTQQKLVESIRQNDDRMLRWLYQENYPKVERFVLANSGTADEAADVYQEAFLSLWTRIKTDRFVPENTTAVQGFLFQVAKNKWLDQLRSSKKKLTVVVEEIPEWADEEDLDRERYFKKIEGAFLNLGDTCRELLSRFYYQKESLSDLAARFGWTEASAKNNKYRCMEKLRRSLKSTGE